MHGEQRSGKEGYVECSSLLIGNAEERGVAYSKSRVDQVDTIRRRHDNDAFALAKKEGANVIDERTHYERREGFISVKSIFFLKKWHSLFGVNTFSTPSISFNNVVSTRSRTASVLPL